MPVTISAFSTNWASTPFAAVGECPWEITSECPTIIRSALADLGKDYAVQEEIAIHQSAVIEGGVTLKGPLIVGPNCLIATGSYLRGGVYLDRDCIIGPNSELKTTIILSGSKLAHLNFVGDSIIGSSVNIEAGAIVANYRNEMEDKQILIEYQSGIIETGVDKFGALIGDNCRIGANAVIAPGALIAQGSKVKRLELVDQHPNARLT